MTMLTNNELQAIRARCEAATPIPIINIFGGQILKIDRDALTDSIDDIPDLLAHIHHQQRALEWMARRSLSYSGESAENFQSICNLALLATEDVPNE